MNFIKGINTELIDKIIETPIVYYALDMNEQDVNIYGESTDKYYNPGIRCNCLIQNDDPSATDDEMGVNYNQTIMCFFYRNTLKEKDFYPVNGDIIKWNSSYYEINNIVDNQLLGGKTQLSHSVNCTAQMVNKSNINVRYEK